MMSPRHWKEIEMAISPRQKSTVPNRRKPLFSSQDKSDQALLHFCCGGRETQQRLCRWSTEEARDDYNSLKMSLLLEMCREI